MLAFWVQIHRVPMEHQSSTNARLIGGKIGFVLEVDYGVNLDKEDWDFLGVKVELDITQLLLPGFFFNQGITLPSRSSSNLKGFSNFASGVAISTIWPLCDSPSPHPFAHLLGHHPKTNPLPKFFFLFSLSFPLAKFTYPSSPVSS